MRLILKRYGYNVTQKLKTRMARSTAREVVSTYGAWVHQPTTADTITRASDIAEMARLSFWDALIVASAEQAGAAQLYSEDLNAGQTIAGVKIINPLVAR